MDFARRVQKGLAELRARDPEGKVVFGAGSHGYLFNAPVPESELARFEKTHGIQLPPDYRTFLAELGNGGAGPYYGIFKLGEMDDSFGFKPWKEGEFVGSLSRPFPHRERWNLSEAELERIQASEDDDEILRTYWIAIDGALPSCHEGCALREWLVVSGPEAGFVWHDGTADFDGWSPCTLSDGRHMTFADWYLDWLEKAVSARAERTA